MKKILSGILAALLTVSAFAFTAFVSAQDDNVVLQMNYSDVYSEIVDKKASATVTKGDETQGEKALKVVPNVLCTDSKTVALDCWSLKITPQQILDTKYVAIRYKLMSPSSAANISKMTFSIAASGGAVSKYTTFTNNLDTVANNWAWALFDITSIHDKVVNEEGKKSTQIHIAPYGGTEISKLTTDDIYYISDIVYYAEKPEINNPGNGTAPAATAQPTKPAEPAPAPSEPAVPEIGDDVPDLVFSFNYSDVNNGIVNHKNSAVVTKDDESQGEKALKVVPNKVDSTEATVYLDCYSLNYPASELAKVKFVSVRYKYVVPDGEPTASKMKLSLLTNGKALKASVGAESALKANEWTEAIFDVSAISRAVQADGSFKQFHLSPFGSTTIASLKEGEEMYISEMKFLSRNPDPNATYEISFVRGNPDADGTNPANLNVKYQEEYTLPECPYTLKTGKFTGWESSYDGKLYNSGDKIVAADTAVKYTAQFEITTDVSEDSKSLVFSSYANGIVDHHDYAYTENTVFDGKDVVKITLNKNYEKQSTGITIDGWSYGSAGIDLEKYKYLVISYYFEGKLPKPAPFRANYMKGKILTKAYGNVSSETIVSDKWAYAIIDLSGVDSVFNPEADNYNLTQMHISVYNGLSLGDLTGDEVMYISQLTFFKEQPDIAEHHAYMKGYDGGYFQPQGNMTRAEACTIVARLVAGSDDLVPTDKTTAFTDVPADQWYHKYISYVESLGYLNSYSGNFLPNQAITRAEFVELVYNMGLLQDAGKNGVFTDVAADHPRANVIAAAGKAGLVNGYDNGDGTFSFKPDATITRAEVVTVINNAYGRRMTIENLSADVRYSFFDVPDDFWAYADICEATLDHIQTGEKWAYAITPPAQLIAGSREVDFAAGEAYLAELDKIAEAKKQEILNTKTEVTVTGTKYYVDSVNGNDANDGKSPETAWKTISKVNATKFKAGDGVFFKRGDIYRTRMTAQTGVTYSAYGEGEKPRFYGSPENGADASKWTLMEGTTNIWIYATEMQDVGTIVLDFKEAALKEVPDLINGEHYVRKQNDKKFDIVTELNENHEFYCEIKDKSLSKAGKIYFRCDEGNPGSIYKSIEFNTRTNVIGGGGSTDVLFDNICVMFGGSHGIGYGTTKNLRVQNCVFGWIGGAIQHYNDNGTVTRFGNGVEIYGGCDGYTIDNCYVYQCYDAGVTHQYGNGTNNNSMYNVTYSNNLIEDCIYSIEYFNGDSVDGKALRDGRNYKITGNILRRAGYGFGNQRPDSNQSSHIKGWTSRNEYDKGSYVIENNIFDRGMWSLIESRATYDAWCPIYKNNTFVQWIDGPIGYNRGGVKHTFDSLADITIKLDIGDNEAKVYWLPASYKHQGFLTR